MKSKLVMPKKLDMLTPSVPFATGSDIKRLCRHQNEIAPLHCNIDYGSQPKGKSRSSLHAKALFQRSYCENVPVDKTPTNANIEVSHTAIAICCITFV